MLAAIARFLGTLLAGLIPAILDYLRSRGEVAKPNPELQKEFMDKDEEFYRKWAEQQNKLRDGSQN